MNVTSIHKGKETHGPRWFTNVYVKQDGASGGLWSIPSWNELFSSGGKQLPLRLRGRSAARTIEHGCRGISPVLSYAQTASLYGAAFRWDN